ncbi:MAG TPA: hypothetical protein O0X31_00935, partial [Methanocorpusculum sp.]|nr:hypothetical protein [Methanocorpusculum sp.]
KVSAIAKVNFDAASTDVNKVWEKKFTIELVKEYKNSAPSTKSAECNNDDGNTFGDGSEPNFPTEILNPSLITAENTKVTEISDAQEYLYVKLRIAVNPGIWGMKNTVLFDENSLEPVHTIQPDSDSDYVMVANRNPGKLTFLTYRNSPTHSYAAEDFFTLIFRKKVDNMDMTGTLTLLTDQIIDESGHDVEIEDLFCVGEVAHPDSSIKLSHTLDLASDISVHYAVPVTVLENYDSFYLSCDLPVYVGNDPIGIRTVEIQPVQNGYYYYFTLAGLLAYNMNDTVRSNLILTKGDEVFISETDEYSIATYAYSIMGKGTATPVLKTLCADLLRYGTEAQKLKGYRTDSLADDAMTEEHRSFLSNIQEIAFTAIDDQTKDLEAPAVTWVGKALDLDSRVGIRYIFNASRFHGDISALTMEVNYKNYAGVEQTVILREPQVYLADADYYAFGFYGLLAAELRTDLSVTIYDGTTRISETLTYSAETYGSKHQNDYLAPVCKALFAYSDSAKNYFVN